MYTTCAALIFIMFKRKMILLCLMQKMIMKVKTDKIWAHSSWHTWLVVKILCVPVYHALPWCRSEPLFMLIVKFLWQSLGKTEKHSPPKKERKFQKKFSKTEKYPPPPKKKKNETRTLYLQIKKKFLQLLLRIMKATNTMLQISFNCEHLLSSHNKGFFAA